MRFRDSKAVFFDIDDTLYDFAASVRVALHVMRGMYPDVFGDRTLEDVTARYWAANATLSDATKLALIDRDPFLYRRATWAAYVERERLGLEPGQRGPESTIEAWTADSASVGQPGTESDLPSRLARTFGHERFARLADSAFPRALETVADVARAGRKVGVISNGPAALQRAKFNALGLPAIVPERHVVISGEFGAKKPDPSIFESALRRVEVAAGEAVFIGDSVECDVASKAVGMSFVYFDAQRREKPDFKAVCGHEPDAVAHDYDEVRRLLGLGS